MRRLLLLTAYGADECDAIADVFDGLATVNVVRTVVALQSAGIDSGDVLLSFGTGVIVPGSFLSALQALAYNLHLGTPQFPGRDPHHHAVYRRAVEFGATLHIMTAKVDEGPILAVERFPVTKDDRPFDLMRKATEAGLRLLRRVGPMLFDPSSLLPSQERWGPVKTRRADFLALCQVTPDLSAEELELRVKAFDQPGYRNLFLDLHGRRFVLDNNIRRPKPNAIDDRLLSGRPPQADAADFQ